MCLASTQERKLKTRKGKESSNRGKSSSITTLSSLQPIKVLHQFPTPPITHAKELQGGVAVLSAESPLAEPAVHHWHPVADKAERVVSDVHRSSSGETVSWKGKKISVSSRSREKDKSDSQCGRFSLCDPLIQVDAHRHLSFHLSSTMIPPSQKEERKGAIKAIEKKRQVGA